MTSLLRELTPVPMAFSRSRTMVSRPRCASARPTASPTTPAPITTASTVSMVDQYTGRGGGRRQASGNCLAAHACLRALDTRRVHGGHREVVRAGCELVEHEDGDARARDRPHVGQRAGAGAMVELVAREVRQRGAVGVRRRGNQLSVAVPFVPPPAAVTVMVNAGSDVVALPSLVEITMPEYVPTCAVVGVPESWALTMLNVAQAGLFVIENPRASPSASLTVGRKL